MKRWTRVTGAAVALASGLAGASFSMAGTARAAQSFGSIPCNGTLYNFRFPTNNSSGQGGWTVLQITDESGHFIPTSFTFSVVDTAPGSTFSFSLPNLKGQGNANANQEQVDCSLSHDSTLANVVPPDFDYQGTGTLPTDPVTVTITLTAVLKINS
jgi:hypothetical protein